MDGVDVSWDGRVVAVGYLLTQRVQVHFVPVKRTVQRRHLNERTNIYSPADLGGPFLLF